MKRSGLRGVSFNRKRCCGSDKARHDRLLVRRLSGIVKLRPSLAAQADDAPTVDSVYKRGQAEPKKAPATGPFFSLQSCAC